jgi:hypothetical protein
LSFKTPVSLLSERESSRSAVAVRDHDYVDGIESESRRQLAARVLRLLDQRP